MGLSFVCTPLTEMGDFRIIFWPSSSSFLLWFRAVGSRREREWKDICLPRFPVLGGPRGESLSATATIISPDLCSPLLLLSFSPIYIQDDFFLDLYPLLLLLLQGRIIRGSVGNQHVFDIGARWRRRPLPPFFVFFSDLQHVICRMCSYDKWRERKLRENTYRVTLHLQCRVFLFQSQGIIQWKEMYFRRSRNRHKSHSSGDNLRLGSVFFTANRSESPDPNLHNFFAIWSCMTVSQQRYNNRDRRQWIEFSLFLADSVCSLGLLNLKSDQISHFKTSAW